MLGGLKNVATEMETVKGNIKVAVEKSDNRFVLDVTVPQNTKALIGIPNSMQRNIKKNGTSVSKKDAQEDKKGGYLLFPVGPGKWKFESLK
ncbi:MAG: alpha-L-rhamnosidase C-terminal domain-containing protein [Bacteroidales bacterium]